jgi:hypothetical protein
VSRNTGTCERDEREDSQSVTYTKSTLLLLASAASFCLARATFLFRKGKGIKL